MIGVESPDAFVYPRINRLEMPGTEPELLRPGEPTPITLSVLVCEGQMANSSDHKCLQIIQNFTVHFYEHSTLHIL